MKWSMQGAQKELTDRIRRRRPAEAEKQPPDKTAVVPRGRQRGSRGGSAVGPARLEEHADQRAAGNRRGNSVAILDDIFCTTWDNARGPAAASSNPPRRSRSVGAVAPSSKRSLSRRSRFSTSENVKIQLSAVAVAVPASPETSTGATAAAAAATTSGAITEASSSGQRTGRQRHRRTGSSLDGEAFQALRASRVEQQWQLITAAVAAATAAEAAAVSSTKRSMRISTSLRRTSSSGDVSRDASKGPRGQERGSSNAPANSSVPKGGPFETRRQCLPILRRRASTGDVGPVAPGVRDGKIREFVVAAPAAAASTAAATSEPSVFAEGVSKNRHFSLPALRRLGSWKDAPQEASKVPDGQPRDFGTAAATATPAAAPADTSVSAGESSKDWRSSLETLLRLDSYGDVSDDDPEVPHAQTQDFGTPTATATATTAAACTSALAEDSSKKRYLSLQALRPVASISGVRPDASEMMDGEHEDFVGAAGVATATPGDTSPSAGGFSKDSCPSSTVPAGSASNGDMRHDYSELPLGRRTYLEAAAADGTSTLSEEPPQTRRHSLPALQRSASSSAGPRRRSSLDIPPSAQRPFSAAALAAGDIAWPALSVGHSGEGASPPPLSPPPLSPPSPSRPTVRRRNSLSVIPPCAPRGAKACVRSDSPDSTRSATWRDSGLGFVIQRAGQRNEELAGRKGSDRDVCFGPPIGESEPGLRHGNVVGAACGFAVVDSPAIARVCSQSSPRSEKESGRGSGFSSLSFYEALVQGAVDSEEDDEDSDDDGEEERVVGSHQGEKRQEGRGERQEKQQPPDPVEEAQKKKEERQQEEGGEGEEGGEQRQHFGGQGRGTTQREHAVGESEHISGGGKREGERTLQASYHSWRSQEPGEGPQVMVSAAAAATPAVTAVAADEGKREEGEEAEEEEEEKPAEEEEEKEEKEEREEREEEREDKKEERGEEQRAEEQGKEEEEEEEEREEGKGVEVEEAEKEEEEGRGQGEKQDEEVEKDEEEEQELEEKIGKDAEGDDAEEVENEQEREIDSEEEEGEEEKQEEEEEEKEEEEEGEEEERHDLRPPPLIVRASSAARLGHMTVSRKYPQTKAEGLHRRSLSLGSAFILPTTETYSGGNENRHQNHRHRHNYHETEPFTMRSARGTPGRRSKNRIDTRSMSAGVFWPRDVNASTCAAPSTKLWDRDHISISRGLQLSEISGASGAKSMAKEAAAAAAAAKVAAAAAAKIAARAAAAAMETAGGRHRVLSAGGRSPSSPTAAPPSVWVARYVDCSSTCGLAFLMSDSSVGLLFKDDTRIVADPGGVTFDFMENPPSSTSAAGTTTLSLSSLIHDAESGAGGRGQGVRSGDIDENGSCASEEGRHLPRHRYSLNYFPFYLRRKVAILKDFRDFFLSECGIVDENGRHPVLAAESRPVSARQAMAGTGIGGDTTSRSLSSLPRSGEGRRGQEPLTFVEKWQRAGDTHCFQLSDQTVQVLFSDGTELMLSKDRRLVTFAADGGRRETQPRQELEHRRDVMKRVRCAEDFIFVMRES